jgi:hypothetical protein
VKRSLGETAIALAGSVALLAAATPAAKPTPVPAPVPVTVKNFQRAESDQYFANFVKQGGSVSSSTTGRRRPSRGRTSFV